MASRKGPEDLDIVLRFGGGVHSRASEDEIDPRECHSGQNFDLDAQNTEYRNRKPIDKIGTAPNAGQINGFVSLQKTDGTVSFLVQAGDTVYEWDGASTFTSKGTVSSSARLRGTLQQNWQLDDKVIITDLALEEVVKEWDGTTLSNTTFTKNNGGGAFGTFKAKYCIISNERAIYANVHSNGTNTPHILVGSLRGDYSDISVDNRPSSGLSAADPWFIIQPDYKVINGLAQSFGVVVTSSHHGSLFNLTGADATDFAFAELYPRSGADGSESLAYAGNDILYGRQGRIESVLSTNKFGNVESDDLSNDIGDVIKDFKGWTLVYNARNQLVYCLPESQTEMWVFHKSIYERFKHIEQGTDSTTQKGLGISPWVKWTSQASHSMQFTAMMNMLDPVDKLEYVFAGDDSGNIYRLEGSGTAGDSGNSNVNTERLSSLIQMPLDAEVYNIEGYIQYRKNEAATLTMKFEYAGMSVFNESITITIPAVSGRPVFGGGLYFNNDAYYGTAFSNRLTRQKFGVPGKSNAFQVRLTVDGTTDFEINSIGFRFSAGS
jgi:hypothetical protein